VTTHGAGKTVGIAKYETHWQCWQVPATSTALGYEGNSSRGVIGLVIALAGDRGVSTVNSSISVGVTSGGQSTSSTSSASSTISNVSSSDLAFSTGTSLALVFSRRPFLRIRLFELTLILLALVNLDLQGLQ